MLTESAKSEDDDIDDIFTEFELSLYEFDSYVQEGVGVKILVGLGIAAALGGLIAIISKLVSSGSSSSSARETKQAKKAVEKLAKKNPDETITCELLYGNQWQIYFAGILKRATACADYITALNEKFGSINRDWSNSGTGPNVELSTGDDGKLQAKISSGEPTSVSQRMRETWDNDDHFEAESKRHKTIYTHTKAFDISPDELKRVFDEMKTDKQAVPVGIIIERINALEGFQDDFRVLLKSLNKCKRDLERYTKNDSAIDDYVRKTYDTKNLLAEITRSTDLITILNTYILAEAHRIKRDAYSKLDNRYRGRIDDIIKDDSNAVSVKSALQDRRSFDAMMDDKNSRPVFK